MEALAQETIDPSGGNGSGIDLYITVRDKDGKIVSQDCKAGDLYLTNWAMLIAALLKYGFTDSAKTYYGFNPVGTQIGYTCTFMSYNGWANAGRCDLGSSVQAAAINDFKTAVFVKSCTPTVPQITSTGNTIKILIPATCSFESETILSEAAMVLSIPYAGQGQVTVTRDTFTAQTVPAGGSITIQFELWFNAMPA